MRDLKLYIFLGSALLLVYLIAQYNKPKQTDWEPSFANTDKIPFGTYVLYQRIADIFPETNVKTFRQPVFNVVNDDKVNDGTYIIICDELQLSKDDYLSLEKFIKRGNDVFIAAGSFSGEIYKQLKVSTSEEFNNPATRIGFLNNQFKDYLYDVDKNCSDNYFYDFDATKAVAIGKNEYHKYNYLRFPIGKGNLYLNANPKMFTNYSMLQDMGASYSSIALSYLKNSRNLYWDTYYSLGPEGSESPMRVLLNDANLRWAFYIAIFSLLIFVLYEMKRRQRIIPIIEPLTNTSVEFATTVGQVYFEQHNNGNIAQKKVTYLLEHIRAKYNIRTQIFNEEFVTTLTQKSGASDELIRTLVQQIVFVGNSTSQINDSDLIALNNNIEQFYFQSS